ncbi:MAG TPA: MFS transporter [Candidatus Limnocylindrales bacterium]|nr:MFS transporter [Candidatus Limnocylindrales bacterium]
MEQRKVISLPPAGQLLYASASTAFTMLERMILLYMPFYYLPPVELGLPGLLPDRTYLGIFTVLGASLLVSRVFDGFTDPVIASLSDNSRSHLGRRKLFLILGGLPLALSTLLVFYPPDLGHATYLNGLWLGSIMVLFYISFTAYVNPYLALLPELGHNTNLRISLATMIAFFGLIGMVMVTVLFPLLTGSLQDAGIEMRAAYRYGALIFAAVSVIMLYVATLGFKENIHCLPAEAQQMGTWQSFRHTFGVKPFRIFLAGEMFLQFAMNLVTLALIYYAVVIFQREEQFIIVLAGLTIGGALLCFPLVNIIAKRIGKKKVITTGVLCLAFSGLAIFLLSFNSAGIYFYIKLALFALAGFPLAVLTILINPTIADLARLDFYTTGQRREAMFFGARAIPLKLTVALAGVVFAFLLSEFGRDIGQALGVQLSALVVAVAALCSYICFRFYPEKQVLAVLKNEE